MTKDLQRRLERLEDAAGRVDVEGKTPRSVLGWLLPCGAVPLTVDDATVGLAGQRERMGLAVTAETLPALRTIAEELLTLPPYTTPQSVILIRRAIVEALPGSPAKGERRLVPGKDGPEVIEIVREKNWQGGAGEA